MNQQPNGVKNMARAVIGALPFIPRGESLPDRTVRIDELPIDATNVAEYAAVTGLRFGDTVPLTYPFALTFPSVMALLTDFEFPFSAMGAVHVENHIKQYRPVAVTESVSVATRAENMREHRKGLLVDIVTEVSVANELAWHQITTFLHQQRTSLSDQPKPAPPKQLKLPPPNVVRKITPGAVRRYAAIGGDLNPIHVSGLGAKLFGFPTVIAHGMYSAAAVLGSLEGELPGRVAYSVRFGKPVVLPANTGLYTERVDDGWDLTLRNIPKGYPHLTGTIRPL